jgi:hypothetical protein
MVLDELKDGEAWPTEVAKAVDFDGLSKCSHLFTLRVHNQPRLQYGACTWRVQNCICEMGGLKRLCV